MVISGEGGVQLTSLEEVISRIGGPIDLMKIDIEGGEWPLLFEVDKKVFDQVGRIVMEYHETSRHQVGDLETAARRLDFKIERIFPNSGFGITWWSRS